MSEGAVKEKSLNVNGILNISSIEEGLQEGLSNDGIVLARFGKRQQLRVRQPAKNWTEPPC